MFAIFRTIQLIQSASATWLRMRTMLFLWFVILGMIPDAASQ